MEAKPKFFNFWSQTKPITNAGIYRLGLKYKGGRTMFTKTITCKSRKEAKRKARELFGKKGIAAAA